MLPKEIRAKRIELLKQIELLERTPGNDQKIRAIGDKLLALTNDRKEVKEEKAGWKKDVREPRSLKLTVEEFIQFIREGLSSKEISQRLGISMTTLQRWQVTNNINKRNLQTKIRNGEL